MKRLRSWMVLGGLVFVLSEAQGETLTNFFAGSVDLLAGDISAFFSTGTTNPLPGVCVMPDLDTARPGSPGSIPEPSDGLNESPGSPGATKDMFFHPSAFNQRRIISAYNPDLFGGTVYVGIDLPGGTGSAINHRFVNTDFGTVRARGQVVPFDADGNGQPNGIGLDSQGRLLSGCPGSDSDLDIWTCTDESTGATDDPRNPLTASDVTAREFYTATITFGDFTSVALDFEVTYTTAPGQADLNITQEPGKTFGVRVSSDTGGTGAPQGFDVIFALTNVNANVAPRGRLSQVIAVDSGSNRDGSGQGEDFNVLQCSYNVAESLIVTAVCPTDTTPPGGVLVITGTVCNLGNSLLTGVVVTNAMAGVATNRVLGPISLAPGDCQTYFSTNVLPTGAAGCSLSAIISAHGQSGAGSALVDTATADCVVVSGRASLQAEKFCPSTPPTFGEPIITSGWICNNGEVTLTDIVLTNRAVGIGTNYVMGPFTLGPGECIGYTNSIIVPTNFNACAVTDAITASATDPCSGATVSGSDSKDCPVATLGLVNCPPRCAEQFSFWSADLNQWPAAYAPTQTVRSVFSRAPTSPGARNLQEALDGAAGTGRIADFLRQAVTGLLNAGSPTIGYPFSVNDVITAVNNAFLNGSTRAITNAAALLQQANEEQTCLPCLLVSQQVSCLLPGDIMGPLGKSATGYRGLTDPAFGYSITVSNCGSVTLTNLVVMDSQFGILNADFFGATNGPLGPRKSVTKFYKMAWHDTTTNSLIVKARSAGTDGTMLMVQDEVVAQVVDGGLTCQAVLSSPTDLDGQPADNHVLLPADGTGHSVQARLVVCNPGPVALKDVTISAGQFNCKAVKPFKLAVGQCVTNDLCARLIDCVATPWNNVFTATGAVDTVDGSCSSGLDGQRIKIVSQCNGLIECRPQGPPAITLTKTPNKSTTNPGGEVIYTYTVNNTGQATFTNVEITDDNGTPDFSGDDFIGGTVSVLAPGASRVLTHTNFLPIALCAEGTNEETGTLIADILTTGNLRLILLQSLRVNDNTFGANAIGWGAGGHQFSDLTSSDEAEFQFRNRAGDVVLQFRQDFLSSNLAEPSGYGSLGVRGGDGGMIVGSPTRIIYYSTSLAENLNTVPFLNALPTYTVDSPTLTDPLSKSWEYRSIYTVVVDKSIFGTKGIGTVSLLEVHNSPAKRAPFEARPCGGCVTNIARVVGHYGSGWLTNFASATVCTVNPAFAPCPYPLSYWTPRPAQWPRYAAQQTVQSVFSESSRYPKVGPKTLIKAIDGQVGTFKMSLLLEQAITALLNAEALGPNFPLKRLDIVLAVNTALVNGSDNALTALTELLLAANEMGECWP